MADVLAKEPSGIVRTVMTAAQYLLVAALLMSAPIAQAADVLKKEMPGFANASQPDGVMVRRYKDMGDGTWAEVIYPGAVGGGPAVVAIDQTTPGTTDSVTVKPQSFTATASFTINAASAHAANDVVGAAAAALTFAGICPAAGREIIFTSTRLRYDIAAIPSGMTSFRLYLYNVTPPSALADDAAFDLPSGDRAAFLGYIDLGSPVDLGGTLYVETNGNQKQVTCASTSVFGYFVTNGAYTTGTDVVSLVINAVAP